MNWISRKFIEPLPFYAVLAALWAWAGMALNVYPVFWAAWVQVMIGAILVNIISIVFLILRATYKKRKAK